MTQQTKTLVTTICEECGEEAAIVRYMFNQDFHQREELTIRGIVTEVTSSELSYTFILECRNCEFTTELRLLTLN